MLSSQRSMLLESRVNYIAILSFIGFMLLGIILYIHFIQAKRMNDQRIAFVSTGYMGKSSIFVAKVLNDGNNFIISNPKQITANEDMCYNPRFSPDGKMITFYTNELPTYAKVWHKPRTAIFTIDVSGHNLHCLTPADADDIWPVFTPDSRKLIFGSSRNSTLQKRPLNYGDAGYCIYAMQVDGSGVTQLTHPDESKYEFDCQPTVSPDGKYIAYISHKAGSNFLYLMNIDGSHQHRLDAQEDSKCCPQFAPDGNDIYYSCLPSKKSNKLGICMISPDGTFHKELPVFTFDAFFTFSSYGDRIIYLAEDSHLHTVNLNGSDQCSYPIKKFPSVKKNNIFISSSCVSFYPYTVSKAGEK